MPARCARCAVPHEHSPCYGGLGDRALPERTVHGLRAYRSLGSIVELAYGIIPSPLWHQNKAPCLDLGQTSTHARMRAKLGVAGIAIRQARAVCVDLAWAYELHEPLPAPGRLLCQLLEFSSDTPEFYRLGEDLWQGYLMLEARTEDGFSLEQWQTVWSRVVAYHAAFDLAA